MRPVGFEMRHSEQGQRGLVQRQGILLRQYVALQNQAPTVRGRAQGGHRQPAGQRTGEAEQGAKGVASIAGAFQRGLHCFDGLPFPAHRARTQRR